MVSPDRPEEAKPDATAQKNQCPDNALQALAWVSQMPVRAAAQNLRSDMKSNDQSWVRLRRALSGGS